MIETFSLPAASLPYPSITICKENGIANTGDYLRAVFDNFQFTCSAPKDSDSCKEISDLSKDFAFYIDAEADDKVGNIVLLFWFLSHLLRAG